MGNKCTPQITGLVRGTPKNPTHRSNGGKICRELGNERFSKSETLDKTRSHLNEYSGMYGDGTGQDCWDKLKEEADSYKMPVKLPDGTAATRGLRKDAVIGFSVIINPPDEMCAGWSPETYDKFSADGYDTLCEIAPRVFRKENIRMVAKHRDEGLPDENGNYGEHEHIVGVPRDENGRYCGNLIDAKMLSEINRKFPAMMREKGWDLDDLDVTDWDRYKTDPAYKAERKAKRKEHGKSTNRYIAAQNRKTQKVLDGREYTLGLWQDAQADLDEELKEREERLSEQEEKMSLRYMKHRAHKQDERDEEQDQREEEQDERERQLDERERALDTRSASLNAQEAQIGRKKEILEKDAETLGKLRYAHSNGLENINGFMRTASRKLSQLVTKPNASEFFKTAVDLYMQKTEKSADRQRSSYEEAEAKSREILEDDIRKKYEQSFQREFG